MHGSREAGSLQGRIPSTRLEPSPDSLSLQLSAQQRESLHQEKQNSKQLYPHQGQVVGPTHPGSNRGSTSELEKPCGLRHKVSSLSAAAQATNSRVAEVSYETPSSSLSPSHSLVRRSSPS